MTTRRILGYVAFILIIALPFAVACTTGGERTRVGCPAGEQCSTLVDGLYFSGVVPTAHSLFAIAEGGTERVRVQIEPGLNHTAYAGSFDARSSDASVLDIGSSSGPEVTVLGAASGHAYLRIVEPETDILLDRVDIRVAPVSRVRVTTLLAAFSSATDDEIAAVWSGASVQLVAALLDSDGGVLWDDSLEVTGHPSTLVELPLGLEFSAVAPASGSLDLSLARDAQTHPISLPVVSAATDIALFPADATVQIEVGSTGSICALGRAPGGLIAGAPVTATYPAFVTEAADAIPTVGGEPIQGCVGFRADAVGTGSVTIAIGAQTASVPITVAPATAPLTGPALDLADAQGWATAGERASE